MMIIMIIIDDYDVLVSRLVVTFSADCHHASLSVGKYWRNYLGDSHQSPVTWIIFQYFYNICPGLSSLVTNWLTLTRPGGEML